MLYLLIVASAASSIGTVGSLLTDDIKGRYPSLIQQEPSVLTLREHTTNSLNADMLKREQQSTPAITFREQAPREPLERDLERHYSK